MENSTVTHTVLYSILDYFMEIGFRFNRPLSHVSGAPTFPIHINSQPEFTFDPEQVLRDLLITEGESSGNQTADSAEQMQSK